VLMMLYIPGAQYKIGFPRVRNSLYTIFRGSNKNQIGKDEIDLDNKTIRFLLMGIIWKYCQNSDTVRLMRLNTMYWFRMKSFIFVSTGFE
jgi:hypothetical protein